MTMKRDIHIELVEGFDALAGERQGTVTLQSHKAALCCPVGQTEQSKTSDTPSTGGRDEVRL